MEECAYSCDPALAPRITAGTTIGLCGSYCNAWFDACKDDYTCVADWATWPTRVVNGTMGYFCPLGATCRTFADLYTNGTGLCNTMWAPAFAYSNDSSTW